MPLIDAHVHVFPEIRGLNAAGLTRGLGYGRARVGEREIQVMPPLCERTAHTPEMLLAQMDWAGVQKAVLLQGPFYGECNDYALAAARKYPGRLAALAYLDPWDANWRTSLEAILGEQTFCGVKLECSEATGLCGVHPGARIDHPDLGMLWAELERRGLVLTLDLGAIGSASYQTRAVHVIAARHPGLKIVIAHLGQPRPEAEGDPAAWRLWQAQIDLGHLPNVWFDTAALPAYASDEGYPFPTAGRYLRWALERIGPEKVLWGTDIPGLLAHATYPQLVKLADWHTRYLAEGDRARILSENAREVYAFGEAGTDDESRIQLFTRFS